MNDMTLIGENWINCFLDRKEHELEHYGVKGMKWGVRRYQNADGTLTSAGKTRYGKAMTTNKEIHKYDNPIRSMIDRLPNKEKDYIGDGYWIDSNHVAYRKVIGNKDRVNGFLDVYTLPRFKNQGLVILATSKEIRGRGGGKTLASSLVKDFNNGLLDDEIRNLRWLVDSDNTVSETLAKSLGFEFISETPEVKEYKYFKK